MGGEHRGRGGGSGSQSSGVGCLDPIVDYSVSGGTRRGVSGGTYLESNTVEDITRIRSFTRLECVHNLEEDRTCQ